MNVPTKPSLRRRLINGFFMSLLMAAVMSLTMTLVNTGPGPGFLFRWLRAFCLGFAAAYPTAFLCGPLAQRLTDKILKTETQNTDDLPSDKI
jgi:hypothetical protein